MVLLSRTIIKEADFKPSSGRKAALTGHRKVSNELERANANSNKKKGRLGETIRTTTWKRSWGGKADKAVA